MIDRYVGYVAATDLMFTRITRYALIHIVSNSTYMQSLAPPMSPYSVIPRL